jgi:hypothetical protein
MYTIIMIDPWGWIGFKSQGCLATRHMLLEVAGDPHGDLLPCTHVHKLCIIYVCCIEKHIENNL